MKYLIFAISMMCSLAVNAQKNMDSISRTKSKSEIEIKLSMSGFEQLKKEKDNAISDYNELLTKYNNLIKEDSIKTAKLKDDSFLKQKYDTLLKIQGKADKCLINMASNFLYIPYEAYSIQEIALPAFEAVSNQELKEQHIIKKHLLESYQIDIKALLDFLIDCEKELSNPFAKNATDALSRFQGLSFCGKYKQYEDWKNTFIGKKIVYVEKQLETFDGKNHKFTPNSLINELEICLKSIEDL